MALPPQPGEERRRRRRPNLRKLMFVLPNLFTVSSIFCGVYSITLSAGEPTGDNFYRAAVAIFFGSFFDAFDGRVARLTRTQSEFGVELDSLADVISFGVAPAVPGAAGLLLVLHPARARRGGALRAQAAARGAAGCRGCAAARAGGAAAAGRGR